MKRVIYVGEEPKGEKGVEFTHHLDGEDGWQETGRKPSEYKKNVYLGCCTYDGDMFAAYNDLNEIVIFKGHLKNGTF